MRFEEADAADAVGGAGAEVSVAGAVDRLLDALAGLGRIKASISAMEAELVDLARSEAEADAIRSGMRPDVAARSFRAELAAALNVSERSADLAMATAYTLVGELTPTLEALREGRISYQHAAELVQETTGLEPDARTAVERAALPFAESMTPRRFKRKVQTLRERRAPESAAIRHETARGERDVSMSSESDGMATLSAYLPAVEAVAIIERLDRAARAAHLAGDPRGVGQLRADVFCAVMLDGDGDERGVAGGDEQKKPAGFPLGPEELSKRFARIRPSVVVTVPLSTLAGGDAPAELEGFGPIDGATARQVASWAPFFRRMITDEVKGIRVEFDRTRYRPPDDLRMFLRLRDGTCTFPGCNRRVAACDLDHTVDWDAHGPTRPGNLAHLCRGHHVMKHDGGWSVTQEVDSSGRLTWTSPRGRRYVREPDPPP